MRLIIALLVFASVSKADTIIFDQSPATTGGSSSGYWKNQAGDQNFSELMVLTGEETLTGMDFYTHNHFPSVGMGVTIRIRSTHDGALLHDFTSVIATIDLDGVGTFANAVRVHADFAAPINLTAGNYYIGMSSAQINVELGAAGILNGNGALLDGISAQYGGTNFVWFTDPNIVGDSPFRVWGADPVPEPGTLALVGLTLAGYARRRRRRNAA